MGGRRLLLGIVCAALGAAAGACSGDGDGDDTAPASDAGQGPSDIRRVPEYEPPESRATPAGDPAVGDSARPARPRTLLSASDRRAFAALERRLGGEIGLVVGSAGARARQQALGGLAGGSAWSTIKVPITLRTIEDAGGPSALGPDERGQISRALTASDNAAAAELWEALKDRHGGASAAAGAVGDVLRRSGDDRTVVSTRGRGSFSPYGQTEWSLADQHRFMASLAAGCATDPATRREVLGLMGSVVADQRWGLGAAGRRARFKGGWGPGVDGRYLVRQMGVLDYATAEGRRRVAVTIAAHAGDGSFETGMRMVTEVARWAAARVDAGAAPQARC